MLSVRLDGWQEVPRNITKNQNADIKLMSKHPTGHKADLIAVKIPVTTKNNRINRPIDSFPATLPPLTCSHT